jgi:flagellar biosynthetic protein FlhB
MSEDRTQAATKHRKQQARERGQVAHSPELTGAAGLLGAVMLLGAYGDDLTGALIALVREPFLGAPIVATDLAEVATRLRHLVFAVFWPLGVVIAGFVVAATAVHQLQVGGLWVPSLFAPNPDRLWTLGRGLGLAARAERGVWSVVKAAVVIAVAAWAIRSGWHDSQRLAAMEAPALARAAGEAFQRLALWLALAILALGVVDFGLQYRRFEALLRMTPEEHREDQRSMEGDPALRARRRRIARSWRGDSAEVLTGATLVLNGSAGLTLVLAGGPPPRRVTIRSALQGVAGLNLRRTAETARLPQVTASDLARRLARRQGPALPLPAEALAELASVWPGDASARG